MAQEQQYLRIRGARTHNLKSVDIDIPLNKITCIGGPSGSGKSSLAFHTITNESKRRFLNSMSSNVKFFSQKPAAVDVDEIFPVLPVFALPQINPVIGSRAAVADTMGLTEVLAQLFYRFSVEVCPKHSESLKVISLKKQLEGLKLFSNKAIVSFFIHKDDFLTVFKDAPLPTKVWSESNKEVIFFDDKESYWEFSKIKVPGFTKLEKLFSSYPELFDRDVFYLNEKTKKLKKIQLKNEAMCSSCGYVGNSKTRVSSFSPYNALGACGICNGFGANLVYDEDKVLNKELSINDGAALLLNYKPFSHLLGTLKQSMKSRKMSVTRPVKELGDSFVKLLYEGDSKFRGYNKLFSYLERKKYKRSVRIYSRRIQREEICSNCLGSRLKVDIGQRILERGERVSLSSLYSSTIQEIFDLISRLDLKKDEYFKKLIKKLFSIIETAIEIGLGNIHVTRKTKTLSAGEYQRFLLLKYMSFEGTSSLFIFDEPSLGLGEYEQKKLLEGVKRICSQGNTVVLIDHSKYLQRKSDQLIVMGPQAGAKGGKVMYEGKPVNYFKDQKPFSIKSKTFKAPRSKIISFGKLEIRDLKFEDIQIPLNQITWIHGRAGSGKTSCYVHGVANYLNYKVNSKKFFDEFPKVKAAKIPKEIADVKLIESNLNRYTSRSTVGSITDIFTVVRKHFLKTPYAKSLDLKEGHLSANSVLGQCEGCDGKGVNIIEMQYLEDIILECELCNGRKLKPHLSEVSDGNLMVYEAYALPMHDLIPNLKLTPKYKRIWEYVKILKLDYLSLDRSLSSLSGGEKQRIYLLSCLIKKLENTAIFFENLSFGLSDVEMVGICEFLQNLLLAGNTVVLLDSNKNFKKICSKEIMFSKYGHVSTLTH